MKLDRGDIINWLKEESVERLSYLYSEGYRVKIEEVGDSVYLRGLIEVSNICRKNCLYCGIRKDNSSPHRYTLSEEEIVERGEIALKMGFGSVVLQGGERGDLQFIQMIERAIKKIKGLSSSSPLGITLSLGEQSEDVYKRWFEAGAHRYLLRIESSDEQLYSKIHPHDPLHSFSKRVDALYSLKKIGYQVGSGVMIGLPFQSVESLAGDLMFLRDFDVDMCGMGPYIPHHCTPLGEIARREGILSNSERFSLSLKMVALLRILMPDINIAATTAMQTLHPTGRELAIKAGANVVMPNITPQRVIKDYMLYENKYFGEVDQLLKDKTINIGYNSWGDSLKFKKKGGIK